MLLKLDNISWPRTLVILDNFTQWLVANTLHLEMIQLLNQKDGFKEIWGLDLSWKSRPVFSTSSMELKFELSPWIKTILILGSEFLLERSNTWSILFRITQKFLQIHKKSKFHKQAQVWLQPGQRQKQNHNRENLLGQQQPYQYMKEDGLTLSHPNKILPRTIFRRKWSTFFDTIKRYSEKKMEQLNSTRKKFHLRHHHSQILHWSDDRWKACLAAGGGSKRRYQYCSDNSGTILYLRALQGHSGNNLIDPTLQDNVLIGTGIFPYIYHVGCTFNLHSVINNGLVPGGQNLSRRQTVFFLPVDPRDESHRDPERIDFSVPCLASDTCTVHGRGIKTRYFGSILILRSVKD